MRAKDKGYSSRPFADNRSSPLHFAVYAIVNVT